jgi:hypothetical protein
MQKEVIDKISDLMTAAFGLVAALAWNEAIQSLFKVGGPFESLAAYGPWAYAIFVTIIAVVMIIWIGRIATKANTVAAKKAK